MEYDQVSFQPIKDRIYSGKFTSEDTDFNTRSQEENFFVSVRECLPFELDNTLGERQDQFFDLIDAEQGD